MGDPLGGLILREESDRSGSPTSYKYADMV